MRKILPWVLTAVMLSAVMLAAPAAITAQTNGNAVATKNSDKARAALNAMVQALGGQAWLNMKNSERDGTVAAFFHGNPDLGTEHFYDYHQWPDHDRLEFGKHRDDILFYLGNQGWEIDYQGKKALPQKELDDFLRDRAHSIETAVKVWMKDPRTILIYEGPRMVERHLGVEVSLISADNKSITLVLDNDTHLPLRREYQYRDPVYHDLDTISEEYDDYHTIDGFPTAFNITQIKNGETTHQLYLTGAKYNQDLPADFWDTNAVARKIVKR